MGAVRDHSILIACIGAGSAVLAAFAKPIVDALTPDAPDPGPKAVAAAPADPTPQPPTPVTPTPSGIEGAWTQYIIRADEPDYDLGTFVVAQFNGKYLVTPRNQTKGDGVENSEGVFDVQYDGRAWTFNSKWDDGRVGNFKLHRVSPTIFEGEIRVAGKLENRTRLVKIE